MIALRVTSCRLQVTSYGFTGCAGRSGLEKQPTDPAYAHARQLKEATRGKGEWSAEVFVPNYVPFLGGLTLLLLKLTQMGICRNDLPITDETMH
jgi:hypothetical protein